MSGNRLDVTKDGVATAQFTLSPSFEPSVYIKTLSLNCSHSSEKTSLYQTGSVSAFLYLERAKHTSGTVYCHGGLTIIVY